MSRQVQFRRGSAVEHNTFVGAEGEITVDTTNNTLRVHDGINPGGFALARQDLVGDTIADTFVSEDGLSWYRKYKSGWLEQGGTSVSANIVFPISFINTEYTVMALPVMIDGGIGTISVSYANKIETGVSIQVRWNGGAVDDASRMWFACGF